MTDLVSVASIKYETTSTHTALQSFNYSYIDMAEALPPGVSLEGNGGPEINRSVSIFAVLAMLALVARLAARRLKAPAWVHLTTPWS